MHLLSNYSLQSGQKIKKPWLLETYFPLQVEKYITIHPFTKDSKTYDYWEEVIDIIYPELQKLGIDIIQLGAKGERKLRHCYETQGQTTLNQVNYILKNSLAHLSSDTFSAHVAGIYDIPLVALYSNNYINNVKPYWGTPSKQILLEPDRQGKKPNFSYQESPKTINTIKPEDVANGLFKLLNINTEYKYKTIKIGDLYNNILVEAVPNTIVDIGSLGIGNIIYRMDLEFSEENLEKQAQVGKVIVYTDRAVSEDLILRNKTNIQEVVLKVDRNTKNNDFVKFLFKNSIKYALITYENNEEILKKLKFLFMDFGLIFPQPIYDLNKENLLYKSHKFILSNGKIYPSVAAYEKNIEIQKLEPEIMPVIDSESFWRDCQHFLFLTKS